MNVIKRQNQSVFTLPLFICGIIALVYYFWDIFPGIYSLDYYIRADAIENVFRFMFAFIGLFFTDLILSRPRIFIDDNKGNELKIEPSPIIIEEKFKRSTWHTLYICLLILICYIVIFLVVILINIAVNPELEFEIFQSGDFSEEEISSLFAPFGEEFFFRGFLLACFISWSYKSKHYRFTLRGHEFSLISIMGVIISTILFTRIHAGYYDDPVKMQGLVVIGLVMGYFFLLYRDLSACVLSHFLINVLALGNIILTVLTIISCFIFYSITFLYDRYVRKSELKRKTQKKTDKNKNKE